MGIRQKIKAEEEWIRQMISDENAKDSPAIRAWNRMLDYFLTNDFLDGHNHMEIINYIYKNRRALHETFYCIAWKNYMAERTLFRYRKKYVRCFKRYYAEEQEKEKFRRAIE